MKFYDPSPLSAPPCELDQCMDSQPSMTSCQCWLKFCLAGLCFFGFFVCVLLIIWFFGDWIQTLEARNRLQRDRRSYLKRFHRDDGEMLKKDGKKNPRGRQGKKTKREIRDECAVKTWNQLVKLEGDLKVAMMEKNIPGVARALTGLKECKYEYVECGDYDGKRQALSRRCRRSCWSSDHVVPRCNPLIRYAFSFLKEKRQLRDAMLDELESAALSAPSRGRARLEGFAL